MKLQLLENVLPKSAFAPVNASTSKVTGDVIDRAGFDSAVITLCFAAATGGSGAATAAVVLEDASEVGFNATNATFVTLAAALVITSAGIAYYNVDLRLANRFIRVTVDPDYSAGSNDHNIISAVVNLGDKNVSPAGSTTVSTGY